MSEEICAGVSGESLSDAELQWVKGYLDSPLVQITGFQLRVFARMGDRIALAIMRLLPLEDRVDDILLRKILTAVRVAFSFLDCIDDDSDRTPVAALRLIEILISKVDSEEGAAVLDTARGRLLPLINTPW